MPIILVTNPSLMELKLIYPHVLSSLGNRWRKNTMQKTRFSDNKSKREVVSI